MSSTTTCTATPAGPNATGGYQAIDQCNNSGATGTVTPGGAGVVSSPNPSALGQVVVFTFTVVRPGSPKTGTVTFFDGSTRLGAGLLVGGQATFAISNLTAGDHGITARLADAGSTTPSGRPRSDRP